jgi:hypothetical protein
LPTARWKRRGSAFELDGLTPHIEEDLADEIFRDLFVPNEPQPETEHPGMVPSIQHLHGEPVALSDAGDPDLRPKPPVSHSMAVSEGWSAWDGRWFDQKAKILDVIQQRFQTVR